MALNERVQLSQKREVEIVACTGRAPSRKQPRSHMSPDQLQSDRRHVATHSHGHRRGLSVLTCIPGKTMGPGSGSGVAASAVWQCCALLRHLRHPTGTSSICVSTGVARSGALAQASGHLRRHFPGGYRFTSTSASTSDGATLAAGGSSAGPSEGLMAAGEGMDKAEEARLLQGELASQAGSSLIDLCRVQAGASIEVMSASRSALCLPACLPHANALMSPVQPSCRGCSLTRTCRRCIAHSRSHVCGWQTCLRHQSW